MLTYVHALGQWADDAPDDIAVRAPELELTSRELWENSLRVVAWLRSSGVADQEAVGAHAPPPLHPIFLMALLARGGVGALVGPNVEVGPSAPLQRLVTVDGMQRSSVEPEALLRFDDVAIARMASIDPSSVAIASPEPDDIVWLIYSSGTTGTPKAVQRTTAGVEGLAVARRRRLAQSPYFSLQPGTVAGSMAAFLSAILVRRPHLSAGTADQNLAILREHTIEIAEGSPFQLDQLLTAARRAGERLPALRELHSAGAPLSEGLAHSLAGWFGVEVFDGYGSSETGFVASRRANDAGAVSRGGVIADDVTVEIVDDDDEQVPAGEQGRVRLRSAGMGVGYAGDPDLGPHKGFRDGWFYPGDLGRLVDGNLIILGREDDLINVAGRKIMPHVVEETVRQVPGVRDAVACVVTDRLGVRQLAIAIVGDPISDPVGFATGLRRPLHGIQPSLVMRIASIPRTQSGKPRREEVARLLQQQLERPASLL